MSADLLRRAATKLREHAEAVPPNEHEEPWYRTQVPQYGFWRLLIEGEPDEAEFIAMMSPAVALALADLLDAAARAAGIPNYPTYAVAGWLASAVEVARQVLREPEVKA